MGSDGVFEEFDRITGTLREEFEGAKRVLSFSEYLELYAEHPRRHSRDAVQYILDAYEHFGSERIEKPWGTAKRYCLFDLEWLGERDRRANSLVGQEGIQGEIHRALANFEREGRPNRLPLLHGPNGSSKTTVARCLMLGLERYSELEDGALYRFHWVFPTRRHTKGSIGFGENTEPDMAESSYAHLPEEGIDARLIDELRDHPLLLLPEQQRRQLIVRAHDGCGVALRKNDWLWNGNLSHKNRAVLEALLSSYAGDWNKVLRHVQVERYYISRRYRVGAVTLGPEMSLDASERQVTADRSLGALPTSLQATALFEVQGELIDASGGVLEFSDLLKRPLDAFKYLQQTVETGEVSLSSQTVKTNCVMLASANEVEAAVFRKHHEYESFRGRLKLIPAPYLRSWREEKAIYDSQIVPTVGDAVAPHATRIAAMFAVLTRLRRPVSERYERSVRDIVRGLKATDKLVLYADGKLPEGLDANDRALLKSSIPKLYQESTTDPDYEGSFGASPREMRTMLLDAAQSTKYRGLSPFAVFEELERLCKRNNEYAWLQFDAEDGGYHDHAEFRIWLRQHHLTLVEDEFRSASEIVEEKKYGELFDKYIYNVSYWVKKEKLHNTVTGEFEEPDVRLMEEVERLLDLPDEPKELRHAWIRQIAAWAIEHPNAAVDNSRIFASSIKRLRDAVFQERRAALARITVDLVVLVRDDGKGLTEEAAQTARACLDGLKRRFGYDDVSAADAAAALVKDRFNDLLQ